MCKSDYHESAWNCAELTDISDIFIGKKSQKFSFFRYWVIRGQSRGNTWFSRLLMVIAQIRKNENLRCIWLIDFLSQVYRLALVSARNMLVTLVPNFSSISCQNREKFEPLLLACRVRVSLKLFYMCFGHSKLQKVFLRYSGENAGENKFFLKVPMDTYVLHYLGYIFWAISSSFISDIIDFSL